MQGGTAVVFGVRASARGAHTLAFSIRIGSFDYLQRSDAVVSSPSGA